MTNPDPRLTQARDLLRAVLESDRTDPDEPGSKPALDLWTELLDITERLEDLIGVEHPE